MFLIILKNCGINIVQKTQRWIEFPKRLRVASKQH